MQQLTSPPQASAEVIVNENFEAVEVASAYAKRAAGTAGLTWGYYGAVLDGAVVADGTVSLTASATNYIVAQRSTGTVSVSTGTTNWNDSTNYARLYVAVTNTTTVTSDVDHRLGQKGLFGNAGVSSPAGLGTANIFTKNQCVQPVVLTDAASIAVDASLSNNFKVTLGGNRTLANPTNLTPGMVLNFEVVQDATGSRTLAYGSAYKWPGGSAPTLSPGANAVDLISGIVNQAGTAILCQISKGFA
jgi:hypothetical protein